MPAKLVRITRMTLFFPEKKIEYRLNKWACSRYCAVAENGVQATTGESHSTQREIRTPEPKPNYWTPSGFGVSESLEVENQLDIRSRLRIDGMGCGTSSCKYEVANADIFLLRKRQRLLFLSSEFHRLFDCIFLFWQAVAK